MKILEILFSILVFSRIEVDYPLQFVKRREAGHRDELQYSGYLRSKPTKDVEQLYTHKRKIRNVCIFDNLLLFTISFYVNLCLILIFDKFKHFMMTAFIVEECKNNIKSK